MRRPIDTEAICRAFAAQDPRIRYVRQSHNIGLVPNENYVLSQARAALFKWASHDDLYGPELVARCVEVLDERPEVVLCHADMATVDENGDIIEKYEYRLATDSARPAERFRSILFTPGGDDSYGVIRTDVLRRVAPLNSYHNPGRTLVAELALNGPFHQVRELLFFRRDHPARGDRRGSIRAVCANLDPRRGDHSSVRLVSEYVLSYLPAIRRAPLSVADRQRCYAIYLEWLAMRTVRKTVRQPA